MLSSTPITRIRTVRFSGNTDRTTSATISEGIAIIRSTIRLRMLSTIPPRTAARKPKKEPSEKARTEAASATKIVIRPP